MRTPTRRVTELLALAGATLVALVCLAAPAGAHTAFESSDPADGTTVDVPIERVTVVFSGPAQPAGDEFQVLDPQGATRPPDRVTDVDERTWVLEFDPPLAGGQVGVRWMVKAPDAHPIDGAFSFTVAAPAVDVAPPTDGGIPGEVPPSAGSQEQAGATGAASDAVPVAATAEDGSLATFLDPPSSAAVEEAERLAAVARIASFAGSLVGLGGLVFLVLVLRGTAGEIDHVLAWIRRASLLVVAGAAVELAGHVAIDAGGAWSEVTSPSGYRTTLGTNMGLAVALRLVGGALMAWGAHVQVGRADDRSRPVVAVPAIEAATAGADRSAHLVADPGPPGPGAPDSSTGRAWAPGAGAAPAVAGALAVLVSYAFDGHTVSEGSRPLTTAIDLVHVVAASVWAGGLFLVASVLWRRRRRGDDPAALELAARFSVVAAAALVAAGLSGVVLAWTVLDSPGDLWRTPWGRLLLVKVALVAVAAGIGAYNRQVLLPDLERDPEGRAPGRFRTAVTVEAGALGVVVAVTAFLVGAAA